MSARPPALAALVTAAQAAFTAHATDPRSIRSIARGFGLLAGSPDKARRADLAEAGKRLPVIDRHMSDAMDPAHVADPKLKRLTEAFLDVEPLLTWGPRSGPAPNASDGFANGHANAMIAGPGGLERRSDVWLGVSFLAPHIRYPDHTHPPEETYLVLSPGEFRQDDDPWFEPGKGGSFYNPPHIRHAMRAGPAPLFAFWLLVPDEKAVP